MPATEERPLTLCQIKILDLLAAGDKTFKHLWMCGPYEYDAGGCIYDVRDFLAELKDLNARWYIQQIAVVDEGAVTTEYSIAPRGSDALTEILRYRGEELDKLLESLGVHPADDGANRRAMYWAGGGVLMILTGLATWYFGVWPFG
jgi:hypothetical protein